MRPFRDEASTIKLWLAWIANHLEIVEPPCKDPFVPDLVGLFVPCSLFRHSLTPTLLSACMPIRESTFHGEKIVAIVDLNNVMENQKEKSQECREQAQEEILWQVVISAEELTTTSVVGQSTSENCDLFTVEQSQQC